LCKIPIFGGGGRLTPISRLAAAYCVDIELRPPPSTGIIPLRRYSESICHLGRPGLSLAGGRLRVTRPHRLRLSLLHWISLCGDAVVITPVACRVLIALGTAYSNCFPLLPAAAALLTLVGGRCIHWFFRVLLDLLSRYGLPVCCIADETHLSGRLRRFRHLRRCFDSYSLGRPRCRTGHAPTEDPHLGTAHTSVRPGTVLVVNGCNSHRASGSLQPVAIGAAVEVTKPSEPSRQTGRMAARRADPGAPG
jgi:hypothetical protein